MSIYMYSGNYLKQKCYFIYVLRLQLKSLTKKHRNIVMAFIINGDTACYFMK